MKRTWSSTLVIGGFFLGLMMIPVFLTVLGVLMLYQAIAPMYKVWEAQDWPRAEATLDRYWTSEASHSSPNYGFSVAYRYVVDGREVTGNTYGVAGERPAYSPEAGRERFDRLREAYREERTVPVWYDPGGSGRAYLDRSLPSNSVILGDLIFGGVCALVGGLILITVAGRVIRIRREQADDESQTASLNIAPGLTSRPDRGSYQAPRIISGLLLLVVSAWFVLVLLGFVMPVPFEAYVRPGGDNPWKFSLAALLAAFIGVSAFVWWHNAAYEKRRYERNDAVFGNVALRLDPYFPKLGDVVGGRFQLDLPLAPERCLLTAELRCSAWYKLGNRSHRREIFLEEQALSCERVEGEEGDGAIRCHFSFDTSDVRVPGDFLRHGLFTWTLTVKGRVGRHEFDRLWGLPVKVQR